MNAPFIVENVIQALCTRYGTQSQVGKGRLLRFGSSLTCSINYSKTLRGNRFFFGLARDVVDVDFVLPETLLGEFVLLVCGSVDSILVIPRRVVVEMMQGVSARRIDVFADEGAYVMQTTGHPKLNVTEYLNAFPERGNSVNEASDNTEPRQAADRDHLRIQWALIQLGRAEGCSVWVPPNDRGLSYREQSLAEGTADRLPNFGFEENTRRIVQNIDVLWMTRNIIAKAFEIEATTMVYSGLLRLNDLVLAQPNNRIDLYVAAAKVRRDRVRAQLMRPSFQTLSPRCEYISFEFIEGQLSRLETFARGMDNARVSGLIRGERFDLPDRAAYPTGL